jgi:hypothetical protein
MPVARRDGRAGSNVNACSALFLRAPATHPARRRSVALAGCLGTFRSGPHLLGSWVETQIRDERCYCGRSLFP